MCEIERAKVQAAYDECYKIYSFYSEHRDTILSVIRAELEREKNEPLTMDELRDMNGKPVYIVVIDKTNIANPEDAFNGWGMVRWSWVRMWDAKRSDLIHVDHDFCDNGKTWLAYRYEPKGEPNV